ncbi:unnamed protein product [Closterium sp. NIES-54]
MLQPEGLDDGSGRVYGAAMYGLKQAPRAWYHKLEETLLSGGFKKSEYDHSLFVLQEKDGFLMLLVYVDDMLLFFESSAIIEHVEGMLEMQFKCSKMGDVKYYLGMHVERDLDKGVLSFNFVKADGTSIGGYVCLFGGGAVSWRSKKQNEPTSCPCSQRAAPEAHAPPTCGPPAAPAARASHACGPPSAPAARAPPACGPPATPTARAPPACSLPAALAALAPPACGPPAARAARALPRLLSALFLALPGFCQPCYAPPCLRASLLWLLSFSSRSITRAIRSIARYSSPATAALGHLLLPYLFPQLSAFATVEDLVAQLRTSDARYRSALQAEFLDKNPPPPPPPPIYITLYFIVTCLHDSLHAVRDRFLALDPIDLTVDLLEQHLLATESSVVAVGATRGSPLTPFFEGCFPSPLAPSYASAAAVDVLGAEDVGAASASGKRHSSKGKGGRGGGGGSRGGGGGSSGGGGGSRGGGSGESGGGSGGLVAAVVAVVRVALVAAMGVVAIRVDLFRGENLVVARGSSSSVGAGPLRPSSFVSDRAGQTCGKPHTQHHCFSHLNNAWRAEFGDEAERPRWAELLRSGVAIFDLDYDAILAAMYALSVSAEGDCYLCVPPNPGIEAAALGASEFALPGTTPTEALNTFTLDSSASRCFFRDSTTLTPLSAPVLFRLVDPSGGPILARSSTVLPCPADAMVTSTTPRGQRVSICTCTRTGRHLATFTCQRGSSLFTLATEPPQVAACAQVSALGPVAPPCSCHLLSHETLLWHHRLGHPSLPRLRGMHSRLLDVTFDESVPFYCLFPFRSAHLRPTPFFLAPGPPPVLLEVLRLGVLSLWVRSLRVLSLRVPSGAEPRGVDPGGGEPAGAEPRGAEPKGAEPRDSAAGGTRATSLGGAGASGPRGSRAAGDGGAARIGGGGTGAGVAGGTGAAGPGGARTGGTRAAGAGCAASVRAGDPGAGAGGGTRAAGPGGARTGGNGAAGAGSAAGVGAGDHGARHTGAGGACPRVGGAVGAGSGDTGRPRPYFVPLLQQPASPLPASSPYTEQTGGLTERREPVSRPALPVRTIQTGRRVPRPRPPLVPGMHHMALRPSCVPQRVPLPSPPASSLADGPDLESDLVRAASPIVTSLQATVIRDPSFDSAAASRLDYSASLVAESKSGCPLSVEGECALGTDILEDRHEEFECFATAVPHLTAMDAEMASWKSTGTYVDAVHPPGANIVDGMWISRVKRLPGFLPAFNACSVARGFSQRQGVDFFQTFSPTPKMTALWVLLHVAAQRDYELHSLDFSTAFLQGSQHEEIWLRRPPGFTGSFPAGTQWSLRRPIYGLRQAPREWHDTLRMTLAALGFAPFTADPSLFLRSDTSLLPFYVLVYIDDLVFATADTEALALLKSALHKRHTCTDLGELRSYLGLHITRDRAWCTITLTESHMVHQVLQRFGFWYSSPQSTPLPTGHSLSAPPSDESVEPIGPYPELVGCLMYLMTCTRPDLAYPLSIMERYVVLRRHQPDHWEAAKRVLRYLCNTSGMGLVLGERVQLSSLDTQTRLGSVCWRSTRSSSVLRSSCEIKIYAGAMAAQELRWLTYLLTDLGERPRSSLVLYVDYKAMIALCQEQRLEHRTKHIAVRYFLARELQQRGQLHLAYVATKANTADIFTKALETGGHQRSVLF